MIKVRKDMSPVVGELQRLALIFCEQDEEKLSLLDDMKCAIEDSMQSKPVCKMVGVKTIHNMAQLLGDSINMVATLAHRYCQSNLDQVQLLQKEVDNLTALVYTNVTSNVTVPKAAEDIIQPEGMAFLQPSFMEAKPEQQEKPSRAPSPTAAKVPREPTSFRPLTFSTVVNEEEALSACQ